MIREANTSDVKRIIELGLLVNKKFDALFDVKSILNEKISKIYVFEFEKNIIGFLHITILYETIDIINIVVDSNYRRMKVATNLLDFMISNLKQNIKIITLEVNINNSAAVELYKKFGFEIINTRKNYYNDKTDAYLMGKKIVYEE